MNVFPPPFRQAVLTKALRAFKDAKLEVVRAEIHPDGRIVIYTTADPDAERQDPRLVNDIEF